MKSAKELALRMAQGATFAMSLTKYMVQKSLDMGSGREPWIWPMPPRSWPGIRPTTGRRSEGVHREAKAQVHRGVTALEWTLN